MWSNVSCVALLLVGLGKQLRRLVLQADADLFHPEFSKYDNEHAKWSFGATGHQQGSARFLQEALLRMTALASLYVGEVVDSRVLNYAPVQLLELECASLSTKTARGE
jgi:hypothetical protein